MTEGGDRGGDGESVLISADHYLAPLGLHDVQLQGGARAHRELFAALVEYLDERGELLDPPPRRTDDPSELHLMLPGSAVHVRLTAINDVHLQGLAAIAAYFEVVHDTKATITLAGLRALSVLFTRVKVEYGERSVVEVVGELDRPTAEDVVGELHGRRCRHPGKGCRYEGEGFCEIDRHHVEETLEGLAAKSVLKRETPVDPVEWSIVL